MDRHVDSPHLSERAMAQVFDVFEDQVRCGRNESVLIWMAVLSEPQGGTATFFLCVTEFCNE